MMAQRIRSRMVLVAVLPVALVVIGIALAFWMGRSRDLEDAHRQRVDLLVRQVALFGGYGLFSGNSASLQNVVDGAKGEPDVVAAHVFDTGGALIVSAGLPPTDSLEAMGQPSYVAKRKAQDIDTVREAIVAARLPLDDFYLDGGVNRQGSPAVLGYVVLEVSRHGVIARKTDALVTTTWLGFLGILVGALLAIRLGNGVVGPILRVSNMVRRIGKGDFAVENAVPGSDPLRELQESLNQMAIRLAWGRDEMENRVASVTHALRLKKEQAEDATQAKSRFLASASHDLRQPTHALGMFVARLGQLPMDHQMRHLVTNLDLSVRSLQDLLDGLLDLSRLDAGSIQARSSPMSLAALLESLLPTLEPIAQAKGLRLRIRPTTLWVQSDAVLLQRVVMNLAINALRYTDRGTVLLACRPGFGGRGVRIEVWDSGIGIAQEHQQNIFKEFYQVDVGNALRERAFGLGLGLNIVERTARLLEAQVSLRSATGCGTRFSIALPHRIVALAEQTPVSGRIAAAVADLIGVRVLLVEDDRAARLAVCELLESWGCVVSPAGNADEARALLQGGHTPDVIVSDYQLGPGDNGLQAIASLRALAQRDVQACLMSGDTDPQLQTDAKNAGLTLLHKPVRPAKLRSLLRRLAASGSAGPVTDA